MRIVTVILSVFLVASTWSQQLNPVVFSFDSGIYSNAISVQLSSPDISSQIYYTTNGSEPTTSDILYTTPLTLLDLNGTANNYSTIPTNPSLNHPYGTYSTVRANSRGWLPTLVEVEKAHIIKAKAFKTGFIESETITKTYFIDPLGVNRYSMPILSVTVDSVGMFSDETGIYVYGNEADGNYSQKDTLWERIMNFELIENGLSVYQQNVRARVHGGGSRHSCKKNLRLYGEYDTKSNFTYPFFNDTEIKKFKRLLLRSGGHSPNCFPRDDLANLITEGLNIDKQHFKHVIVFMNGEYWGIHSIKERMDDYFFQNMYGIDDDSLTILDQEFNVQGNGIQSDSAVMKDLELFIINNDMTQTSNYDYVTSKIDVDNYVDYMCSEIYLSNVDWVYSNVVSWRRTGALIPGAGAGYDGRFRWALYDLDGGFGGDCKNAYYTVNTLNAATISSGTFASYTRFFRGLLENETFKNKFINRMCDLLNSWFKPDVVKSHMNAIKSVLDLEINEEVNRWHFPSGASTIEDRNLETPSTQQWDTTFILLNRFADRRARKQREHFLLKWPSIIDTSYITVDVNNTEMGFVQVNTLLLNQNIPGVSAGVYPWTGIYMNNVELPIKAIAKPGYKFIEWQGTGVTQNAITWTPNGDSTFVAVFGVDLTYQPVLINEVMLRNKDYYADNFNEFDDWTELFNPNTYAIDLSACKITKGGFEWTIPNGTVIQPNDYLIFWNDNETYQGNNHLNFKLQNVADIIYLKSPSNQTIDSLSYPQTTKNQSYGRFPNGSNTYVIFDSATPKMNNDFSNIDQNNQSIKLIAYPNPSSNLVYFNKPITFGLYDMTGRLILNKLNQTNMDVSILKNGIYLIQTTDKEIIKIIVNSH